MNNQITSERNFRFLEAYYNGFHKNDAYANQVFNRMEWPEMAEHYTCKEALGSSTHSEFINLCKEIAKKEIYPSLKLIQDEDGTNMRSDKQLAVAKEKMNCFLEANTNIPSKEVIAMADDIIKAIATAAHKVDIEKKTLSQGYSLN